MGTARRGLALAVGGQLLVGPDNGLFTPFLAGDGWRAFEIAEADYRLPFVSRTFHGRDLFAPAAAHLALGLDPARLGPAVTDPARLVWPEVRAVAGAVAGAVVHTDRFGNLITSIHARSTDLLDAGVVIRVGGREVPVVGTYAELPVGTAGRAGGLGRTAGDRGARGQRRGGATRAPGHAGGGQSDDFGVEAPEAAPLAATVGLRGGGGRLVGLVRLVGLIGLSVLSDLSDVVPGDDDDFSSLRAFLRASEG